MNNIFDFDDENEPNNAPVYDNISALKPVPDFINGLNPEQKEAVMKTEGPLLVLAGAGTGKTKVLTTRLAYILNNNNLVVSDAIQKCMEIISDITHYTSVVIGPSVESSTLQQISIIALEDDEDEGTTDQRVVAVLVTNQGVVENKQVNISRDINLKELIKTSEIINKALVGTSLSKVSERLELEIKPRIKDVINRYEEVCNFFSSAFRDFTIDNSDIVFGGKTNILDYKEYDTPDKVKEMIAKLENTELVKNIQTNDSDINVYIGEETEFDPDVTIIKTHYKVGKDEGTLAIIGPKRMEYDKVFTLLNFLKSYIEK